MKNKLHSNLTLKLNILLILGLIGCYGIIFKKIFFINKLPTIIAYLIIPLTLATLLKFAIIKKNITYKIKTIFIFFLFFIVLYFMQTGYLIGLTYDEHMKSIHPSWVQYKIALKNSLPFDKRTPIEVVADLKKKGERVAPTLAPSMFWRGTEKIIINGKKILPLAGISNIKTVYCNESGNYTIYKSDEHGFNNPLGLYKENLDILLIGDSMVHGACVGSNENIAHFIREQYPKTLNLGYGDNGPLSELATLTEFGTLLKPKLTLWFYYEGNDIDGLTNEKNNKLLTRYLDENYIENIYKYQSEIDRQLLLIAEKRFNESISKKTPFFSKDNIEIFMKNSKGFLFLRPLRMTLGLLPEFTDSIIDFIHPELDFLKKILNIAKHKVDSWNGKLVFIYLPELNNFFKKNFERFDHPQVLKVVNNIGIKHIDILPIFKTHQDPQSLFPLRVSVHYTKEGYEIIAKEVLSFIKKETLLK